VAGALSDGLAFRAIQTGSDELALGAIAALRERGLRIPDDVAIFGIGNMEWSAHLTPALSTHGGHLEKVADTIREMFQAFRMNQPIAPVTTFERPLIHRSSA